MAQQGPSAQQWTASVILASGAPWVGNELGEKDLTEEACGHIKGVQTGPTQGRDQIFNKLRENNQE